MSWADGPCTIGPLVLQPGHRVNLAPSWGCSAAGAARGLQNRLRGAVEASWVGSIPIHPRQTFLEALFQGKLNTETGPRGRFSSFRAPVKPEPRRRQTSGSCANNYPETVGYFKNRTRLRKPDPG